MLTNIQCTFHGTRQRLHLKKKRMKNINIQTTSQNKQSLRFLKRVHPMPVLHFLFLVSNYIMECGPLRLKLWTAVSHVGALLVFAVERKQDAVRIQNGVCFIACGNGIRPQRQRQSGRSFHSRSVSALRVHTPESKAARKPLEWVGGED